jgi:hypothetical protein
MRGVLIMRAAGSASCTPVEAQLLGQMLAKHVLCRVPKVQLHHVVVKYLQVFRQTLAS